MFDVLVRYVTVNESLIKMVKIVSAVRMNRASFWLITERI